MKELLPLLPVLILMTMILVGSTALASGEARSTARPAATATQTVRPKPTASSTVRPKPTASSTVRPTVTVTTPTLLIPVDAIPSARYDYGCVPDASGGIECVTADMPFVKQVAHVMFAEGSAFSLQLLMDMLQVLQNNLYAAWTCSIRICSNKIWQGLNPDKIPWAAITQDQFMRLTQFVLSQPYHLVVKEYPCWNGWAMPIKGTKTLPAWEQVNYDWTVQAVKNWLRDCPGWDEESGYACIGLETLTRSWFPQHPVRVASVLFFYSTQDGLLGNGAPIVAVDKIDMGSYTEYVQFLTDAGANYVGGK